MVFKYSIVVCGDARDQVVFLPILYTNKSDNIAEAKTSYGAHHVVDDGIESAESEDELVEEANNEVLAQRKCGRLVLPKGHIQSSSKTLQIVTGHIQIGTSCFSPSLFSAPRHSATYHFATTTFRNSRTARIKAGKNAKSGEQVETEPTTRKTMEPNTMLAHITGARGLYMKNKTSMEAFATITLQGKGSLRSRCATEATHTGGDCRWDEVCEFKLSDKFNSVVVSVHSKSKIGSGELIGRCELDLENAKIIHGQTNWLRLKKKNNDEKYRGEIQIRLEFIYEKPSMSVSSLSLNHIGDDHKESSGGGGGLMSKMKKKITQVKNGHKKAEDTMSMASAWSATSKVSTKSNKSKIFGKLGSKFGFKDKDKTLPAGTFLTPMDNHLETSSEKMYEAANNGGEGSASINSSFNVFDNIHNSSRPPSAISGVLMNNSSNLNPFSDSMSPEASQPAARRQSHTPAGGRFVGIGAITGAATLPHAMTSPVMAQSSEMFRRSGSIRSTASSGFGGSTKNHQKIIDQTNSDDLLAVIDSLKLELQVKDSRMKDMQGYMDMLISRVMERNPELLAASATNQKQPRMRFF